VVLKMRDTQSQENDIQINNFYRDAYRRTIKWVSIMAIVCAVLATVLVWMTYDPKQPLYYAAVTTGEVVPLHALSEPVVTDEFIAQWSALTTRLIYNLNFSTYQQQLSQVQDRFTPTGWDKMMAALKNSGLIDELVNNKLIVTSVVTGQPVILGRLIIHGRYTWRVQMKLLVTFTSASAATNRSLVVTMNVQRVSTLSAANGIQVVDFSAESAN
jgi:intracellular multiplication protein IcmL